MNAWGRCSCHLRIALLANLVAAPMALAQPGHNLQIVASHDLKIGGATLQVDFAAGPLDLSQEAILAHIRAALPLSLLITAIFQWIAIASLLSHHPIGTGLATEQHGATWPDSRR